MGSAAVHQASRLQDLWVWHLRASLGGGISMTPDTRLRPFHLLFRVIKMGSEKCDPVPSEHLDLISEAVGYCSQGKRVGHEGHVSAPCSIKTIKRLIWRLWWCSCSNSYCKHFKWMRAYLLKRYISHPRLSWKQQLQMTCWDYFSIWLIWFWSIKWGIKKIIGDGILLMETNAIRRFQSVAAAL